MSYLVTFDRNSNIIRVRLADSSSTTGAGLTGLTSASAGLNISVISDNQKACTTYTQAGGTIETIATLGTYAQPTATKCRFAQIDATNMPGLYEIQFDDAIFSVADATSLIVCISGATNLMQTMLHIPLQRFDLQSATVTAGTVSDKTGYSLSQAFPTNFSSLAITAGGAVTAGTISDKSGYSLTADYDPAKTAAQASTALSTAVWTNTKAGYIDMALSDIPTAAEIDTQLSGTHGAGLWSSASGSGAVTWTYTVTDSGTGLPLDGASVKITSDVAGLNPVASGTTDAFGVATFYLDAGTYYVWTELAGYNFTNPDTEVVS